MEVVFVGPEVVVFAIAVQGVDVSDVVLTFPRTD